MRALGRVRKEPFPDLFRRREYAAVFDGISQFTQTSHDPIPIQAVVNFLANFLAARDARLFQHLQMVRDRRTADPELGKCLTHVHWFVFPQEKDDL